MRINVYTEELPADKFPQFEIVTAEYISSRTGQPMKNYGLRIYLKSHPDLHFVPPRDDDRSAITFWCGSKEKNVFEFIDQMRDQSYASTLDTWRQKVEQTQNDAEAKL